MIPIPNMGDRRQNPYSIFGIPSLKQINRITFRQPGYPM
ncbi:hypothetical protein D3OALGA1CA_3526 [Olavius algarvensis associated proteobacterium Delta 3]|nr:hypothetical protein D3OALGB2SA_3777 [Olavius algarvensis associated proteobacterium Delta 3]CAB5135779.1 hypothetical protein D3OALGA1CA_3526 [Olavius algarvensis associated proteobacterium Delta 3]